MSIACSIFPSGPITYVNRFAYRSSGLSAAWYASPTFLSGSDRSRNVYPNFSAKALFSAGLSNEMPRITTPFFS